MKAEKKNVAKKTVQPQKYITVNGKSQRIPKIVLGKHPEIIQAYFSLPGEHRKQIRQLIENMNTVLSFGPLKGKTFKALLQNNEMEVKSFYMPKIFGAVKNKETAIKAFRHFGNNENPNPQQILNRLAEAE